MPLSRERTLLAAKVAQMHFAAENPLTLDEIARDLNVNKATVSRLLKAAWRSGILRLSIDLPPMEHLEALLVRHYGLSGARVVPLVRPEEAAYSFRRLLGETAARYLDGDKLFFPERGTIALGCGATIREVVVALSTRTFQYGPRLRQLVVETDTQDSIDEAPFTLLGILHAKWGKTAQVRAIQPLPGTLDAKPPREDRTYTEIALHDAADTDTAILGVGAVHPLGNSGFWRLCAEAHIPLSELARRRVVGEMLNRPYTEAGEDVFDEIAVEYPALRELTRAVPLGTLRHLVDGGRRVVAVAGGCAKTTAIATALNQRWISHLVTDSGVATELCELKEASGEAPHTEMTAET